MTSLTPNGYCMPILSAVVEISQRAKFMVGFEMLAMPQRDITPE